MGHIHNAIMIAYVYITKIIKGADGRVDVYKEGGVKIASYTDTETIAISNQSVNIGDVAIGGIGVVPNEAGIELEAPTYPNTSYIGNAQGLFEILRGYFFNKTNASGSGGGGGGDATLAEQEAQTDILTNIYIAQGTQTDSPASNPGASFSQIALAKGIFSNGLKFKSFESVVEESTGVEYYRAIDFDPNTLPATTAYIDPLTGLVATAPTNPITVIGALKGILSNTAKPTQSNHYRNSGTTNTVVVKVGQTQIIGGSFVNRTAGTKYLRIYDSTLPTPALTPVLEIAAIQGASVQIPARVGFISGLSYIVSASANQAGAQLTTADAASVQIIYS